MTRTGTSHFVSLAAALAYYRPYLGAPHFNGGDIGPRKQRKLRDEENARIVAAKLKDGEIHIGKPELKPGQTLALNKSEGRYLILSK